MDISNKRVLLTSVCRPIGPRYGDATSVGYELLFGQVTREQGIFSPRVCHVLFSLDYIAENLEAPSVVLQYPSRREFIRELKKGYDYIGVSFVLALFHRAKETVALIRKYSPSSKIILGGYGTVLSDEVLKPYADYICREEGVGFMRRLLGESELPLPYKHPMVISRLKVFSFPASKTGMIFAGLGCPNGCDFCCTSHFFKRKHIRLLPTGQDIYNVIERYLALDPSMVFSILDEDFLLNKKRATEFRECVLRGGRPLSIFAFSSVRAISQYTTEEILEMGIDGLWVGYEGKRSGFAKQQGRLIEEIFRELRESGITVLASMIVGFPYQNEQIIREELDGLLSLKPSLAQFLIYNPILGTPFYERVMSEGLLHKDFADDREEYYRKCTGFVSMVRHPHLGPGQIEALQRRCFEEDFARLGPSIYRVMETWLLGYDRLKGSDNPFLRKKARMMAGDLRKTYPIFLAGRLLGPNKAVRQWISRLEERVHQSLGRPVFLERFASVAAIVAALWTGLKLRLHLFEHPKLSRNVYRWPMESPRLAGAWKRIAEYGPHVSLEIRPENRVWVRLEEILSHQEARRLGDDLALALARRKEHLVLDLTKLAHLGADAAKQFSLSLKDYRERISVAAPPSFVNPRVTAWLAILSIHRFP
ncbi:MAG: hypothetical protein AAB091_06515 [Elusimicrobiota bacterium]|mgnify:CR=1 FL=1